MVHMVNSLRKHQKLIVLGAALSIISLYMAPLDQIGNALSADKAKGIDNAISHIQGTADKISNNLNIPEDTRYRIVGHLEGTVIPHLIDVKYRILGI